MKRYHLYFSSIALMLIASLVSGGCGDKLLPPDDNSGTNNGPYTLKGDLVLETPLPADAKLALVWGVSTGNQYGYVHGRGTIDRQNNTFEITLPDKPPISATNWFVPGAYDTGFGVAMIAVIPDSVPEDQILYESSDVFDPLYGTVDFSYLIYFSVDPDGLWPSDTNGCYDWAEQFAAGYKVGRGVKAKNGCWFDGFTPIPSTGLKLIINSDPARFTYADWS